MIPLRVLLSRLLGLFSRQRRDTDLSDEIQAHLDLLSEQNVRHGMLAAEARAAARREFGAVEQIKDSYRDQRGLPFVDALTQDIRYAVRTMRRAPGFTAVAVLTLAVGIGAVTAIFSVVDVTLLQPLPYPNADRLVALRSSSPSRGLPDGERTARANLADWQAQAGSFEAIAGYRWRTIDLTGGERSERLRGLVVTPEFFEVFGVRPHIGRGFGTEDRGTPTIVLSSHVWQRRFGADPNVVGKAFGLNVMNFKRVGPTPYLVLGIAAADVYFPPLTGDFQLSVAGINEAIDFWTPEYTESTSNREERVFDVVGKLRPGVTITEAQAEMDAIARRLADTYPTSNRDWGIRITPLRNEVLGNARRVVLMLSLSGCFVLLIACGNVASLLLARGLAREKEVAIRAALGAGRLRIVRQFLVESTLLALAGAALGVIITALGVGLLRPFLPPAVPLLQGLEVNSRVLGFTLFAALLTACTTGIAPALRILRGDGPAVPQFEGRGLSPGRKRHRSLGALVAVEIALTLILLIGTGLLVRSAARLLQIDPGFNASNLLTMSISLPSNKFEWKHNVVFSRQVIASVKSLPPVRGAAVIQGVPMRTGSFWGRFEIESGEPQISGGELVARIRVVSPGYFNVMQIPVRSGRDFDERDEVGEVGQLRGVIVNQALASHYWPGEDAVGKRIRADAGNAQPWTTVIGVVGDVRYAGIDSEPGFDAYYPEGLFPQAAITLLARTTGDPLNALADIRSRIHQIDNEAFVSDVRPMGMLIADYLAPRRFSTTLLTAFAGIALLLALIGIYSVIAQSVVQRKLEIGIRMALGAEPWHVIVLVLRSALVPAVIGIAVGLGGAVATTRLLSSMLFGVRPLDLGTWVTVPFMLIAVCSLASYIPARRALEVDPNLALRAE